LDFFGFGCLEQRVFQLLEMALESFKGQVFKTYVRNVSKKFFYLEKAMQASS
jgi:hypothetical protein